MGKETTVSKMTTIYHGGTETVLHPKVDAGRPGLDFGCGFYTTKILTQAQKWADRASRQLSEPAVVNVYSFDEGKAQEEYRKLCFEAYDLEWLQFIVKCRKGFDPSDEYDYVEGGVANDRVVDTVEGFINGTIDAEHALNELSKYQPNHQICFLNQSLVDKYVSFVSTL